MSWREPLSRSKELRPAVERPEEVHLHLHGVTAEDIAAIFDRRDE